MEIAGRESGLYGGWSNISHVHLRSWEIVWRNAPRIWRDFGSALPFQTCFTQTKPVLSLSNEHGSQVKDQGRRQCCQNKHNNFPYRPTRDVVLLSGHASYLFSTYSSRTLTHFPHLGKSSNILLQSGSFSLSSSWPLLCTVPMNKASSADKSQSVTHYFNKISPSTRATLKSDLDVVVIIVIDIRSYSSPLHHIWHETLSLLQIHTRLSTEGWISIGDTCFAHTNRITLRTSSQNHVSNAVATAHQLIPWIASDLLLRQLLRVTATTSANPYGKM